MSLIPKSSQSLAAAQKGWQRIENPRNYIGGIVTKTTEDDVSQTDLSELLTAIPTPWARATLLKSLVSKTDKELNDDNSLKYMKSALESELKGLIIAVAEESNLFSIQSVKINKEATGEDPLLDHFQLTHTLSKFLTEDLWKLWTEMSNENGEDAEKTLIIDLLFYNKVLVGFLYPETLFVTTEDYNLTDFESKPYIHNGKFCAPKQKMDEQTSAYINMIIEEFRKAQGTRNHFGDLIKLLNAIERDENADNSREVTLLSSRSSKISGILNSQKLFFFDDVTGAFARFNNEENVQAIFLSDLFLDSNNTQIVEFEGVNKENFSTFLEIDQNGEKRFFAWPFTQQGVKYLRSSVKESNVNAISIGDKRIENTKLTIEFKINLGNSQTYDKKISYDLSETSIVNKQIITYPDFISEAWAEPYYIYNELPSNGQQDIIAKFMFGTIDAIKGRLNLLENETEADFTKTILSSHNDRLINYETIESNQPFLGLILVNRTSKKQGGVLFRKDENITRAGNVAYNVGIDFGSNNTCISIQQSNSNDSEIVNFKNRRKFFIGNEVHSNKNHAALQHEMLFFTNEEIPTNKIKSLLLEQKLEDVNMSEESASGNKYTLKYAIPVFEKNINVENTNFQRSTIDIKLSGTDSKMKYDLKWEDDEQNLNLIKSFLRTLITQLKAEMFAEKQGVISKIAWSFPGVDPQMRSIYNNKVWQQLFPIGGNNPDISNITESEAIYYFMNSNKGNVQAGANSLGVGIDIGGSTSDIVVRKGNNENFHQSLFLAAGTLAKQTQKENTFLSATTAFIQHINNEEVRNMYIPQNSNPYLFNQLVDVLDAKDLLSYYSTLKANCPNMFVLNAYLTGFVVMHTAMQAGVMAKDNNIVNTLDLHIYGKGGQIFDWILSQYPNTTYFSDCAKYGLFLSLNDPKRVNDFNVLITAPSQRNENSLLKTEVSTGLCAFLNNEPVTSSAGSNSGGVVFGEESQAEVSSSDNQVLKDDAIFLLEDMKHIANESLNKTFTEIIDFDVLKEISNYNVSIAPKCFDMFLTKVFLPFVSNPNIGLMPDVSFANKYEAKWNFPNFINNHPIYKRAQSNPKEPIKTSILSLEAQCFMERILLPQIQK